MSLETFTAAYLDCAIWSSSDELGASLYDSHDEGDLGWESRSRMREECSEFFTAHASYWAPHWSDDQAGHDFWLTRNGHGTGFWDRYARGEGRSIGERLTKEAKACGGRDLYVGDDYKVHQA